MSILTVKIDSNNFSEKITQYIEQEKYTQARYLLSKAYIVSPLKVELYIWEAILELNCKQFHQAYQAIFLASYFSKNKKGIYFLKAVILEKLGLLSASEKACRKEMYFDPENKKIILYLELLLKKLGRNKTYIESAIFHPINNDSKLTKKYSNSSNIQACLESPSIPLSLSKQKKIVESEIIDILIPVYDDYQSSKDCIDSVLKSLDYNQNYYNLLIINDCSPCEKINDYLQTLSKIGVIELLCNTTNLGFIDTVNKGFSQHKKRDVILLNADTIIKSNALDRLYHCAYAVDKIATVTPFSNNAELVSFPLPMQNNHLINIHQDTEKLDKICKTVNNHQSIEIPTGVGCCMYIRRTALEEIGYLNNTELQRGYGEEVDLCLRFSAAGWENHCACNVFIAHLGGRSFKHEKRLRVVQNTQVLNKKHPNYQANYQDFLNKDPLYRYRNKIERVLVGENTKKYRLVVIPSEGYQSLIMQTLRFSYAAKSGNTLYLHQDDNTFYLKEDKSMGYENLTYPCSKENTLLIQHLQKLKITSVVFYAEKSLNKALIDIVKKINISRKNYINPTYHTSLSHKNNIPFHHIRKTNKLNNIIILVLLDNNFSLLLRLARYIAITNDKIQLLKLGDCINSSELLHTGKVKIFPKNSLSNDNITEFLIATGIDAFIDLNEEKSSHSDLFIIKRLLDAGIETSIKKKNTPKEWLNINCLNTRHTTYEKDGKSMGDVVKYLKKLANTK